MNRLLIVIIFTVFIVPLNALGTLRVKSIKELPETHMNLEVRDADGKFAPVLIVKTELKGLGFHNVSRPTKHAAKYIEGDHHYRFYMNDNQRVVKITHSDYEPLEVRLMADFGIDVKAQRVYEMVLTNVPEKEFIIVNIVSEPPDAEKIIDDKNMGTGQSFELFIGSHSLKLQKSGYKSITKDIEVSKSKTLFNDLNLQEVEPVLITIKSIPTGANIFLDDVEIGKTNYQPFKFPGTYKLRLSLSKYETIEKTITVSENGNNIFRYDLVKNTVMLIISVSPSESDVYLNNENISIKFNELDKFGKIEIVENQDEIEGLELDSFNPFMPHKEVSPGRYRIEVSKDGYFSQTRTIDIVKGKDVTESFTLKQKTGKLQFVVEPMEANITLKKDGKTIDNWKGSKMKTNLQVGEYEIICQANRFKTKTEKVVIELDKTNIMDLVMEEGSDVPDNMIFVQGGTFQMGSNDGDSDEKPIHTVTVSDFYIGKYEVTQKEWKEIMGSSPSRSDLETYDVTQKTLNEIMNSIPRWKGNNLPIVNVNWYDAVEFCNMKSEQEGLTQCYTGFWKYIKCDFNANGYRLPTEAEWEYACRGGSRTVQYKYSGSNNIKDVAWYNGNSKGKTHPVGTKQSNDLGIYDMSGNVWEWCNDWYDKNYYGKSSSHDPKGADSSSYRVLRGGSWGYYDYNCQVVNRFYSNLDNRYFYYRGFRLARTP